MGVVLVQLAIPLSLAVLLLGSVELGRRLGQRGGTTESTFDSGAIQGAMLGLLGLLLGFSFAGASSRFMERQDLLVQEANAIGTAYLRAGLLEEPHREVLREELRVYTASRMERSRTLYYAITEDEAAQIRLRHERIWNSAESGVQARPAVAVAVLNPVNDVLDFHALRVASGRKHLPGLVVALLVGCSSLTLGVIGYSVGVARNRSPFLTTVVALLVCAALWTTIDLDRPRIGLIRISDQALADLESGLR